MQIDPVSRVRRFNRAVTSEAGALDSSFLGRGRPLGAARVLNAIGHGMTDVSDIREYLDLDSGLMARLLRSLEDEGLISTATHPDDGRKRIATLTEKGMEEFGYYEDISNSRASGVISSFQDQERLLDAMDLIASVLGRSRIKITECDAVSEEALYCLNTYYKELNERFEQGFEVGKSRDPEAAEMKRPRGVFLVAVSDGLPVGCVGLKGTDNLYAEIKRLWVAKSVRGLGLAKDLMAEVENVARDLGYSQLKLDTNRALPEAVRFYKNAGWAEIDRFNDDPYADYFFQKNL